MPSGVSWRSDSLTLIRPPAYHLRTRDEVDCLESGLRRGLRARARAAAALRLAHLHPRVLHPRGRRAPRAPPAARPHEPGHHLHRLRREGGARAHLPLRLRAAHHPRRRVEAAPGRPRPAHHRAQPVPPRHLPGAEVPSRQGHPAGAGPLPAGVQARAARGRPAAEDLHPRGGHRHHPRRRGALPRPRGQLPRAERRVLRPREPHPPQPRLPGVLRLLSGAARSTTTRACSSRPCSTPPRGPARARSRSCSRPASTTPPTSSTPSSPARWASPSWRGATSSSKATASSCGAPMASARWTSSTGGWTTSSSIPSPSAATACSACPGSSTSIARAMSSSPMPRGRGWPTTRASTPSCPPSSSTTWTRTRSSPRCPPISASARTTSATSPSTPTPS